MQQDPNSQLKETNKAYQLWNLAKKIKADKFPQVVLRESIFELIYILERLEELRASTKADFSSVNRDEARNLFTSIRSIGFYSQCLVLWSYRILEILKETSNFRIPPDLKIARDILVAHYGIAYGKLTARLNRRHGFIVSPKISANGNLMYTLGPLGGPASAASSSELQTIKHLYKKYCPEESEPNIWEICWKIICKDNVRISRKDLDEIRKFIRNNGGTITDSDRIIGYVINSLKEYCAKYNHE